jgi:hypothetical protein
MPEAGDGDVEGGEPAKRCGRLGGSGGASAGTDPDADLGLPRIRATVAPAPCDKHARTQYRGS